MKDTLTILSGRCPVRGWGRIAGLLTLLLSVSSTAGADTSVAGLAPVSEITRRSDILERKRQAKLDSLLAPREPALEKILQYIETGKVIGKLRYGYYGFYPAFGGLSTNAEIVGGVRYLNNELVRNSSLFWSASLSANRYQQYDAGFAVNRIGPLPAGFELYSRYRNFPEEEHFGLGPESRLENESVFRFEDYTAMLRLAFRPIEALRLAGKTGYLRSRTAGGGDNNETSVERILPAVDLPGFKESIEYWLAGFSAALDSRDSRGNPRSGVLLTGSHVLYADQDGNRYDFQYSSAEFQGYLPFFHKHRVLALRAQVANAETRNDGLVPFSFLPYVGGANSIRGFEEYRFRDSKLLLANVEYRFEAFIGLDVALFGDFGQVAGKWEEFRAPDFESSYGGGLRFNTAQSVFLRFDLGHGHEGTRFYLKFSNVF